MQLNSTEIADLIKKRIEQFKVVTEARDEGTTMVSSVFTAYPTSCRAKCWTSVMACMALP